MKVYFIYLNDKINTPSLYAITDDKNLKNSFMEERKKSLFIVKQKEIDKKDYKNFISRHDGYLLGRRCFETKSSSSELLKNRAVAYITATWSEEMRVHTSMDKVVLEISRFTDEYSGAFNKKILSALNTLLYFDVLAYKCDMTGNSSYLTSGFNYLPPNDFRIDALGVFLYYYGYTMSTD